jgi:hypothetical protein
MSSIADDLFLNPSEEFARVVCALLNTTDLNAIQSDYLLFDAADLDEDDDIDEEIWTMPRGVEVLLEMKGVSTPSFTWGHVTVGRYRGRLFVALQDASPFMVYYV